MTASNNSASFNPWPHRLAVVLCCATFPLIWIGGLVTTYDAGMAVPDWPRTFGYNLFLYPWQTWVSGPFDLFIEHGHRLLGAAVGFLTIAFVVTVFVTDRRTSFRMAALIAFALVVTQGVLGGQRVRFDARTLALLHGCLGLATFGYLSAMAVVTSRYWREHRAEPATAASAKLLRVALLTAALTYVQVVLGALLRHVPVGASPQFFRAAVLFHLVVAIAVATHVLLAALTTWRSYRTQRLLVWPATVVAGLVAGQLLLGMATWVLKYGWPSWFADASFAAGFTIEANGLLQSTITTAHVATGAWILALSVVLSLRCVRFFRPVTAVASTGVVWMGAPA